ncbi:MAG: prefoldin subunit [Candidatus Diapherotrites archaeon]|uniref:Prefoldin subunit beta n=1 Tax=Candidatus Iainarchaeum sp. TaxID=3101447 RepID=A0A7J4IQQ3_9ARCH|nr:MAG: prefoldin, chaperonin cofactor, prefoldin beta subunit [archaeon GW2011_AR10]MBS3059283.1 prefoldin subunit [Candidatus Diapherotrites archaeon]HIH07833.1 prefoldin subunit beta [Candidatus Diapherotrites archaeon]
MANIQESIMEFEKARNQLLSISAQKQQLQLQSEALGQALDELKDSKEEKVFKAVGNILILKDAKEVKKEVDEQKETVDLRFKTVQKQEDALIDKMNKLKNEIEKAQKSASASAGSGKQSKSS